MMMIGMLGVWPLRATPALGQSDTASAQPVQHLIDVPWANPSAESPEAALAMAAQVEAYREAGPTPNGTPIPRTPWGQPDLSGIWTKRPSWTTRNSAEDIQPLPFTPAGLKAFNNVWNEGPDPQGLCIFPGVPRLANSGFYPVQIVQLPDKVIFLYEFMHNFRIIPTDGRPHPKELLPSLLGNSVGKWEGDTLVVDTIGFTDRTRLDDHGNVHSADMHVIERYRRVSADQIRYEATIDDPTYYTEAWTYGYIWPLTPPDWRIAEYACTENNFSLESGSQRPGPLDGSLRDGSAIGKMPEVGR